MYDEGKGVPQNDKTAVKWYRLAAKQGDADAQEQVEKLQKKIAQLENEKKPKPAKQVAKKSPTPSSADFQKGLDAAQKGDFATALREWKPLAEQGNAPAQFNLGLIYAKGQGVTRNYKTALKWFRLAAEQGLAGAQFNLGLMYEKGRGVPQNDKTAAKWWKLSAEQGLADAQYNLGLMYEKGRGVIQDNVYAHMWGNLAASNGNEIGGKLRDLVAKKMTTSQLEKAQDLARECMKKNYKGC